MATLHRLGVGRRCFAEDPLMVESGLQGVLIVGCGRSGLAAARLHRRRGDPRPLWLHDDRPEALATAVDQGFEAFHGDLADVAFAVWSPGVALASPFAARVREAGARIISEVSFAAVDLPPCVVVTGTNGKSTVCSLITEMLVEDGRAVACAGNVGTPTSDLALGGEAHDLLVVELSSYQLELPLELELRVAILTNLAPDHLDRYDDVQDYYRTKWAMFENMPEMAGAVLPYDLSQADQMPERGRIAGQVLRDPMVEVSSWARSSALQGQVGLENLAQSVTAARFLGASDEAMQRAASSFAGLPHRAQRVGEFGGHTYVDDSKATNVAAAIASLARVEGRVVVLLGGAGKGEDYSELAQCIDQRGAGAVCFGAEAQALAAATGAPQVDDLAAAVRLARRQLTAGGTILLAPACASFDAYNSFVARGEHFAALARDEVNA